MLFAFSFKFCVSGTLPSEDQLNYWFFELVQEFDQNLWKLEKNRLGVKFDLKSSKRILQVDSNAANFVFGESEGEVCSFTFSLF